MYICAHNKAMRSACFVYWEITGRKKKEKGKGKACDYARPLLQGNNAETEVRQAVRERRGKKTGFKKKYRKPWVSAESLSTITAALQVL